MAEWEMVDGEYRGHYYCWIGRLLLASAGNKRLRKEAVRRRPSALTKPETSHFSIGCDMMPPDWQPSSNPNDLCFFSAPLISYIRNSPKITPDKRLSMFSTSCYIHSICSNSKLTEFSHWKTLCFPSLGIKRPISGSLRAPLGI